MKSKYKLSGLGIIIIIIMLIFMGIFRFRIVRFLAYTEQRQQTRSD